MLVAVANVAAGVTGLGVAGRKVVVGPGVLSRGCWLIRIRVKGLVVINGLAGDTVGAGFGAWGASSGVSSPTGVTEPGVTEVVASDGSAVRGASVLDSVLDGGDDGSSFLLLQPAVRPKIKETRVSVKSVLVFSIHTSVKVDAMAFLVS